MKTGIMKKRRGGFTLVELITVIAIMAILVTLLVGAFGGIKNYQAGVSTDQMMSALTAALRQYYADNASYPWVDTSIPFSASLATQVGDFKPASADLQPPTGTAGVNVVLDQPSALLYNALSAKHGHGAYFPGGAGETMTKKTLSSGTGTVLYQFPVFVDGWGRQIYYWPADLAAAPPATVRPPRATGDGVTVTLSLPPGSYQCPVHRQIKANVPGVCSYVDPVTNAPCGRQMVCPRGPILESLGSLENNDRDNVISWGTLTSP
jgi:prepilin-type N-terminal cleavage/methylation domain-containing protein